MRFLLHAPAVHKRALEGDDAYADAVVKEALRLRAVIPGVGATTIPPGVVIPLGTRGNDGPGRPPRNVGSVPGVPPNGFPPEPGIGPNWREAKP